jgi:hypothetical protein
VRWGSGGHGIGGCPAKRIGHAEPKSKEVPRAREWLITRE